MNIQQYKKRIAEILELLKTDVTTAERISLVHELEDLLSAFFVE